MGGVLAMAAILPKFRGYDARTDEYAEARRGAGLGLIPGGGGGCGGAERRVPFAWFAAARVAGAGRSAISRAVPVNTGFLPKPRAAALPSRVDGDPSAFRPARRTQRKA